jgi:hypothetical protein
VNAETCVLLGHTSIGVFRLPTAGPRAAHVKAEKYPELQSIWLHNYVDQTSNGGRAGISSIECRPFQIDDDDVYVEVVVDDIVLILCIPISEDDVQLVQRFKIGDHWPRTKYKGGALKVQVLPSAIGLVHMKPISRSGRPPVNVRMELRPRPLLGAAEALRRLRLGTDQESVWTDQFEMNQNRAPRAMQYDDWTGIAVVQWESGDVSHTTVWQFGAS